MKMIAKGNYTARATGEYEIGRTETGNEQIGVSFELTRGEHAGKVLTWYGYLNNDDNIKRTMRSLRACGWQGDDITRLDGIDAHEVTVVVEVNEYDGKATNRIAFVNARSVAMKNVLPDVAKRSLAERMRNFAIASRIGTQGPSQSAVRPSAASPSMAPNQAPEIASRTQGLASSTSVDIGEIPF